MPSDQSADARLLSENDEAAEDVACATELTEWLRTVPDVPSMERSAFEYGFELGWRDKGKRDEAAPRWTAAFPTAPGWYWHRGWWTCGAAPLQVVERPNSDGDLIALANDASGEFDWVDRMGGEWCGPLAPPTEETTDAG